MNCRDFVAFLMDYVEGTLSDAQRGAFAAHMEACPGCENYLDSYAQTVRLGKQVCDPEGPLPEDVPEGLLRAILAARAAE